MVTPGKRDKFFDRVVQEVDHAYYKHGEQSWSRHEFYGVLKEEFDELWDEIKADGSDEDLLKEMFQVVCVCLKYYETSFR